MVMKKLSDSTKALTTKTGQSGVANKKDFQSTMAALRKASGKPEYVLIPMCCAVHDRPYVIIYSRVDPSMKFKITKIVNEASDIKSQGKGLIAKHLEGKSQAARSYDIAEFDSAGRYCPWCQDNGDVVHCADCKETYCSGTTKRLGDGSALYKCVPRCGSSGMLKDYSKLHGNKGKAMKGGVKQKMLPSTYRPALSGQMDRLGLPKK
jgi:hypothetical protein|tara:strand:+ start:1179 stop:1799 length:621 start_codon:yes stop_codon:yes gene_type:complete